MRMLFRNESPTKQLFGLNILTFGSIRCPTGSDKSNCDGRQCPAGQPHVHTVSNGVQRVELSRPIMSDGSGVDVCPTSSRWPLTNSRTSPPKDAVPFRQNFILLHYSQKLGLSGHRPVGSNW